MHLKKDLHLSFNIALINECMRYDNCKSCKWSRWNEHNPGTNYYDCINYNVFNTFQDVRYAIEVFNKKRKLL